MGDCRRFDLFAGLIASRFDNRASRIADVAGGKGYMRAAMHERGYQRVTTWDKRHENAKGRPGTRWGHFLCESAPADYDLVVGMHPDGATDHIIKYALRHRVPFAVCPCCIMPSAAAFWGRYTFGAWAAHLIKMATEGNFQVEETALKMLGRNLVLIGTPT